MATCPDCVAASKRLWGQYRADCVVCSARHIARGPVCAEAAKAGRITSPYRRQLESVVGERHWFALHGVVTAWLNGHAHEAVPTWPY